MSEVEAKVVPLTEEEVARREEMALLDAKYKADAEAKAAAKITASAKLAKLGLTEEEITALIGA